jgi:WXG100 protein secretion system (Wss), protein YukD
MVLITVVRGDRRRDLAVRGDVPIAELLRPLADALALAPVSGPTPGLPALAPVCGVSLPPERSLEACGVGHGAVLVLLDRPEGTLPAPAWRHGEQPRGRPQRRR